MQIISIGGVGDVNAIALAPPAFAPYGGQIVGSTSSGQVVALDVDSLTWVVIAGGVGLGSDLVFDGGRLYVAGSNNSIFTVLPDGTVSLLVSNAHGGKDGLALDEAGQRGTLHHVPQRGKADQQNAGVFGEGVKGHVGCKSTT